MEKNQREVRQHQEDLALNRALVWVGGAIVLECLLLFVNRYYINYFVSDINMAVAVHSILRVLRIGGFVAGLLSLVWSGFQFFRGARAGLPTVLGWVCLVVAFCAYVTLAFQKSGMQMLFLLVPAFGGLALVYYLYQRELFLAAAASGMAGLGLWFVRSSGNREAVALLAGIVLVAAAALLLKKSGGVVPRANGKAARVLEADTSYGLVFLSCLVGVAAVVAAMILGANIAYYLIFVIVAWLFALLVYYTVKMM
ncbi:MAG: hypothetical protein VB071_03910 [Lawsonibacter sp.]|nr:hypothetical protein [Lawsonibacter sp.]